MKYSTLIHRQITSQTNIIVRSLAGCIPQLTDNLDEDFDILLVGYLRTQGRPEEVLFVYSSNHEACFNEEEVEAIENIVDMLARECKSKNEFKIRWAQEVQFMKELFEYDLDYDHYGMKEHFMRESTSCGEKTVDI